MCVGCAQSGLAAAESIGLEPQTTKLIFNVAACDGAFIWNNSRF
jgi:hypothetical protein